VSAGADTEGGGQDAAGAGAVWHLTREGLPAVRGAEGFVHCSYTAQLAGTIDVHFAGARELVLLRLHRERLGARLVAEPSRDGALFPHLYGEIAPDDVAGRITLVRGPDGRFDLSALPA
jgi:uncharacterized protein (DUF952 family)